MEYADGGDLASKIHDVKEAGETLSEEEIIDIFQQIWDGMKYWHDRKIVHRDIKSQNIFLTSKGEAKIGDFGIAKILEHTQDNLQTLVGTPWYLSPEIIENKGYNLKSDIYSLGVMLYEMWALKHPYKAESIHALALQIVMGKYEPLPTTYSKPLRYLVDNLLSKEPETRMNIDQIIEFLVNIYFNFLEYKNQTTRNKNRNSFRNRRGI